MNRRKIKGKLKWKIAIAILVIAIVVSVRPVYNGIVTNVQQLTNADIILIDPGHGGIDGGAESAQGVCEKDINLSIALHIKALAEADGWKVVMTREEDVSLHDEDNRTIRSQKTADLIARREMIEKVEPLVAVSVHLNSFKQDRSVRGAQTFYPSGSGDETVLEDSKKLAEAIQERLVGGIADGTERTALAKRDVLMFKHPVVPMAIVECGFLSNAEEAKLLEREDYQKKLAKYIYEGILLYTGKEPREPIEAIDSRG